MEWNQKNILIIGANGGIGSALAKQLSESSAIIYGTYRRTKPTENYWDSSHLFELDFEGNLEEIQSKIQHILTSNNIDIVILAAGSAYFGNFSQMSLHDIQHTYQVDLISPIVIAQSVLKYFLEKGEGHFHIVAAIAGLLPAVKNMAVYTSSKFGLVGFVRALAMETVGTQVRVSVSCPSGVITDLPKNALGDKEGFLKIIEILKKNFESAEDVAKGILEGMGSREVLNLPTEKAKALSKRT